ncbi:hypothetical protein H0H93_015961, partial [Arthromyces matolae]
GDNLAPQKQSLNNEPIPKAVARVLNAEKIREQFRLKKRAHEEDGDPKGNKRRKVGDDTNNARSKKEAKATSKLAIKPGESIQHFNRRVEDDMRTLVKSAVQSSNAAIRNVAKTEKEARIAKHNAKNGVAKSSKPVDNPPPPVAPPADKHAHKAKEFLTTSTSAPRRLNDIAQAPPEFKRLPRGAVTSEQGSAGKREGVISMAQKLMLEQEREKAIARYRELKSRQRNDVVA